MLMWLISKGSWNQLFVLPTVLSTLEIISPILISFILLKNLCYKYTMILAFQFRLRQKFLFLAVMWLLSQIRWTSLWLGEHCHQRDISLGTSTLPARPRNSDFWIAAGHLPWVYLNTLLTKFYIVVKLCSTP